MKKLTIILGLFTLSGSSSFSQVIDSAYMRVSYIIKSGNKPGITDSLAVDIGRTVSECYSHYRNYADSVMLKEATRNFSLGINKIDISQVKIRGTSARIYKNFPQNQITVTDQVVQDPCLYRDSLNLFNWIIAIDTFTTILGFRCQRAETYFRGRNYRAWFTNEIPVSEGPLKFSGLPGLILSVRDEKGRFSFECSAVQFFTTKIPIVFKKEDYIKITRKKYRELMQLKATDPVGLARTYGMESRSVDGQAQIPSPVKYDPMELE